MPPGQWKTSPGGFHFMLPDMSRTIMASGATLVKSPVSVQASSVVQVWA